MTFEIIGLDGSWLGEFPTPAIAEHVHRQHPGSVIVTIGKAGILLVGQESART